MRWQHSHCTWAVRYNSASACKKVRARVTPSIIHCHSTKTQGRVTNAHVLLVTCPTRPPSWPVVLHQPFRPALWAAALPPVLPTTTPDFVQARVRNFRNQSLASTTINPALEPSSLFVSIATKTPVVTAAPNDFHSFAIRQVTTVRGSAYALTRLIHR